MKLYILLMAGFVLGMPAVSQEPAHNDNLDLSPDALAYIDSLNFSPEERNLVIENSSKDCAIICAVLPIACLPCIINGG